MIYTTARIFLVLQYRRIVSTNGTEQMAKIYVPLELDREGSKNQLRHTEPPQSISLSTKTINGGVGNIGSEKFVQELLDITFQQEQQQSGA